MNDKGNLTREEKGGQGDKADESQEITIKSDVNYNI